MPIEQEQALCLHQVSIHYGAAAVVRDCDFALQRGEIGALLGASGSGKSTLLKAIAGLLPIAGGEIYMQNQLVSGDGVHIPSQQREVGMLFQDYALFPHLNALENVCFGLRHLPTAAAKDKALSMLERVQLADFAKRFPHELSGGQQQRVALARALVREPRLLLLDEPFSSLDQAVREHLIDDLRLLFKEQHISALLVTHNKGEAFALADKVALMKAGQVVDSAAPQQLYDHSVQGELATVLGHLCLISAVKVGDGAQSAFGALPLPLSARDAPEGEALSIALRPHRYDLHAAQEDGATVMEVQFLGDMSRYRLQQGKSSAEFLSTKRFVCGQKVRVVFH